jgi:hypoxia up-regulated 1
MRFPTKTFPNLKSLLGKLIDDDVVKEYKATFGNIVVPATSSNTVAFEVEGDVYRLEELVAMMLKHARRQAEQYGETKVTGAVITVPPHFTVFERQALKDSCAIAGLKLYALLNDHSAGRFN